jgi:hypothetical protein
MNKIVKQTAKKMLFITLISSSSIFAMKPFKGQEDFFPQKTMAQQKEDYSQEIRSQNRQNFIKDRRQAFCPHLLQQHQQFLQQQTALVPFQDPFSQKHDQINHVENQNTAQKNNGQEIILTVYPGQNQGRPKLVFQSSLQDLRYVFLKMESFLPQEAFHAVKSFLPANFLALQNSSLTLYNPKSEPMAYQQLRFQNMDELKKTFDHAFGQKGPDLSGFEIEFQSHPQ